MEKIKPVILVICDYYLPGFESGGAMRTLVNMVERLSDTYDFKIVTRDHDGLDKTSYANVRISDWNEIENADVYYLSKDEIRLGAIKKLVQQTKPNAVYLNSFFSPLTFFSLFLRRFHQIGAIPVISAPEGELLSGALAIKPLKKRLYIAAAKLLRLFRDIVWKLASDFERDEIQSVFADAKTMFIAPNMPPRMILGGYEQSQKPEKRQGHAKLVFLSRISRKKNLHWLFEIVKNVTGDLAIDVYGPIEDKEYWNECQQVIDTLPPNIKIETKGSISHESVARTLVGYHFFVLPTLGENFGHIFIEALAAGCPLIISDRSPWRHLESEGVGWDIALENPDKWLRVINDCLEMDNRDYQAMSERARKYAVDWLAAPDVEQANRDVLKFALSQAD